MFGYIRKFFEDRAADKRARQDKKRALKVLTHMFAVRDGSPDYEIAHLADERVGTEAYDRFVADLVARGLIRLYHPGEEVFGKVLTDARYFPTRAARSFAGIPHIRC